MSKTNWEELKMCYASDPTMSIEDIAKKYKVKASTVTWHCRHDKWSEAREEYSQKLHEKLSEKLIEKEAEKTAERLVKINQIADELMDKLQQAVSELGKAAMPFVEKKVTEGKKGKKTTETRKLMIVDTLIDTLAARQISDGLKNLQSLYTGTEIDTEDTEDALIEIGARNEEEESNMDTTT